MIITSMTNALTWRRITVPSPITHTSGSGAFGEDPIWFFGGVGYCAQDHPGLTRYLNAGNVRVEPVAGPPVAYQDAVAEASTQQPPDDPPPFQDGTGLGRHLRDPYL